MRYSLRQILGEGRVWFCNTVITWIPSHTIRLFYFRSIMDFNIGKGSSIHLGCIFTAKGKLVIGDNSTINNRCYIDTRGGIRIGSNVSISPFSMILTADHDLQDCEFLGRESEVIIEDYVFIGSRTTILKGVHLYNGSSLAACSLLLRNIPDKEIFGGVPAKKIGERNIDLNYKVDYKRLFH